MSETFEDYYTKTWCSSGGIENFDTSIERDVWNHQQKKIDALENKLAEAVDCLEHYADCDNYRFAERGCISGTKYYVMKDARPFKAELIYERITGKPFNQDHERN